MTNISIIEVDLGAPVDSIIQEDVTELTAANQRHIDDAIREATTQQEALAAAKTAKDNADRARAQQMETLYQELLTASQASDTSYLSSQQILTLAAPEMANMISFVGRMRNWLTAQQKPHRLSSVKKGKETGYRLDRIEEAPQEPQAET